MNAACLAHDTVLDPVQLKAALVDLCTYERVLVEGRAQAVQVYAAADEGEIPVHLPRPAGPVWTVELAAS